jgi:hypothetical protein
MKSPFYPNKTPRFHPHLAIFFQRFANFFRKALESGEHPLGLAAPQFLGFSTAMLNNQRISIHVYTVYYIVFICSFIDYSDSVYLHVYFFLHFFEDITSIFFMIIRTHISGSIPGANP